MSTIPLSDLTLEDLLPHRGNMLFVKKVLEVDSKHARTLCRPEKSWPMTDGKEIHPLILIELAAQTAGVCNGWHRIQTQGLDSDQMGWLVGIKKAEIFIEYLPLGCEQVMDTKLIGEITLQLFQA